MAERLDFAHYKNKSQWTIEINEGTDASLRGKSVEDNPYWPRDSAQCQAWHYGYMNNEAVFNGKSPH